MSFTGTVEYGAYSAVIFGAETLPEVLAQREYYIDYYTSINGVDGIDRTIKRTSIREDCTACKGSGRATTKRHTKRQPRFIPSKSCASCDGTGGDDLKDTDDV